MATIAHYRICRFHNEALHLFKVQFFAGGRYLSVNMQQICSYMGYKYLLTARNQRSGYGVFQRISPPMLNHLRSAVVSTSSVDYYKLASFVEHLQCAPAIIGGIFSSIRQSNKVPHTATCQGWRNVAA